MYQRKSHETAKEPNSKLMKTIGNIGFVLILIFSALIIFFALQSRLTNAGTSVAGYHFYSVLSGSMEPVLHTGSLVLVHPIPVEQLQAGDIITFKSASGGDLVTHRIASVLTGSTPSFVTRGDANGAEDTHRVPPGTSSGKSG
jgi:signal peptidase